MQGVKSGHVRLLDGFDASLDKTSKPGCWLWTRAKSYGYGRLFVHGKGVMAHRHAYERQYGLIPDGLVVCHRCDEPSCCNPEHLFVGSQADNLADMRSKRRGNICERNRSAKLTQQQVDDIRRRYAAGGVSMSQLGRQVGVGPGSIFKIVHFVNWKVAC
jgi:hypothetical protein